MYVLCILQLVTGTQELTFRSDYLCLVDGVKKVCVVVIMEEIEDESNTIRRKMKSYRFRIKVNIDIETPTQIVHILYRYCCEIRW